MTRDVARVAPQSLFGGRSVATPRVLGRGHLDGLVPSAERLLHSPGSAAKGTLACQPHLSAFLALRPLVYSQGSSVATLVSASNPSTKQLLNPEKAAEALQRAV